MSFFEIIVTFLELAAVVLLIVGFINEKKIIAFEVKLAKAIAIHIRNYRRRKQAQVRMAYANVQSRAPEDVEDTEEAEQKPALRVISNNSSHRVA